MTQSAAADALLNFWKKQVEEATKAWADPGQFWRPIMDPAIGAWASLMARGPVGPEVMAQWKQFLDQWIEAWGEALERAMHSEAFAGALGRYLDQWVATQGPVRKAAAEVSEAATAALGLASRTDVAAIARQLTGLEDRLDELSEQLRAVLESRDGRSAQREAPSRMRHRRAAKRRRT